MAICYDSKKYYERYRSHSLVSEESLPTLSTDVIDAPQTNFVEQNQSDDVFQPSLLPRLKSTKSKQSQDNDDDCESEVSASVEGNTDTTDGGGIQSTSNTDNQTILRLLEEGEKVNSHVILLYHLDRPFPVYLRNLFFYLRIYINLPYWAGVFML